MKKDSNKNLSPEKKKFRLAVKLALREGGAGLGIVLILALALKIWHPYEYNRSNPLSQHPVADEQLYLESALRIAQGQLAPDHAYQMAPLYPYLLAPIFLITEDEQPDLAVRYIQGVSGVFSLLLLYLIARFLGLSKNWGLFACVVMVLYCPFTFFEAKALIASFAVFFSLLTLLLLVRLYQRPCLPISVMAGFSTGILGALRPNLLLIGAISAIWILLSFKGKTRFLLCVVYLGAMGIIIAPFTLHNYHKEEDFILLSDNGGVNFYLGNNPEARGSFYTTDPTWGNIKDQHRMARSIAEQEAGERLKPSQISSFWFKKGLEFIKEQPGNYLLLLCEKLKSFMENYEYSIIYSPEAEKPFTKSLKLLFVPFAPILALAAAGICLIVMNRKKKPDLGCWTPAFILLIANLLTALIFFNYSRFRLAAVPALILLGAYFLQFGLKGASRRSRIICALGAGLALLVSLIPAGDLSRIHFAHGLATVGGAFKAEMDWENADKCYSDALKTCSEMDLIYGERAKVRIQLKQYDLAKKDLETALNLKPNSATHLATLAGFYAFESPYKDLDLALETIDKALKKGAPAPEQNSWILFTAGNIQMTLKDYDKAIQYYHQALKHTPEDTALLEAQRMAMLLNQ